MDFLTKKRVESWARELGISGSIEELFEKYTTSIYLDPVIRSDPQLIEDVVNGGGGDGGVDAAAVIINNQIILDPADIETALNPGNQNQLQLFFLQAKTSEKFDMKLISKFLHGVTSITKAASLETPTKHPAAWHTLCTIFSSVLDDFGRFRGEKIECEIIYVTTAKNDGSKSVASDDQVQSALADIEQLGVFGSPLNFKSQGQADLYQRHQEINGPQNVSFSWPKKVSLPEANRVDEAYVGVVSGKELASLLIEDGRQRRSIFDANVRLYQGEDNTVNEKIRNTLVSENELTHFPFLNNGLTIVANEMTATGDKVMLSGYHIVNGGQTSVEIIKWIQSLEAKDPGFRDNRLGELYVPLKVVASHDAEIRKTITVATNLQTAITKTDIQSSSPQAQRVEQFFEQSGLNGLYYQRQSSHEIADFVGSRIVNTEAINRAFYAVIFGRSSQTIRAPKELADSSNPIWLQEFPPAAYYFASLTMYRIDAFFNRNKASEDIRLKAARYHIGMLVGLKILPGLEKATRDDLPESAWADKLSKMSFFKVSEIETEKWIKIIDDAINFTIPIVRKYFILKIADGTPLIKDNVRALSIQQDLKDSLKSESKR